MQKFFTIALLGFVMFTGCSKQDNQLGQEEFKKYSFTDHRYTVSFEYPTEFVAPDTNYFATSNIIQNEFHNDEGIQFIFSAGDLGASVAPNIMNNYEECQNFEKNQLILYQCYNAKDYRYSANYTDSLYGKSYHLRISSEKEIDPDLNNKLKHVIESFNIEDNFSNVLTWQSTQFDEVLTVHHPKNIQIEKTAGQSLTLSDSYNYNITVKYISEKNNSQDYAFWKDFYGIIPNRTTPYPININFIKNGESIHLNADIYFEGVFYNITTGNLEGVTYKKENAVKPDMQILEEVYLDPTTDAIKYYQFFNKIVGNLEFDVSKVQTVLSEIEDVESQINTNQNMLIAETSDWQTYKNEEYGFSFEYPEGWILEESQNIISLHSPDLVSNSYADSFTLEVTKNDFDSQKNEVENSDLIDDNISLSKFNNDIKELSINGLESKTGTHSTAIGVNEKYYFISLSNDTALYFEFLEPTEKVNTKVEDVIYTTSKTF